MGDKGIFKCAGFRKIWVSNDGESVTGDSNTLPIGHRALSHLHDRIATVAVAKEVLLDNIKNDVIEILSSTFLIACVTSYQKCAS